jgi:hypothetical protein
MIEQRWCLKCDGCGTEFDKFDRTMVKRMADGQENWIRVTWQGVDQVACGPKCAVLLVDNEDVFTERTSGRD